MSEYKTELFMLDSGAFSVWNKGASIDLDEYIQFCKRHPKISYYVCLDVIQGSAKASEKDVVCEQTWKNYIKMIKELPIEKVIPVFHRGEDWKWLEKYLDFGSPYIGFGQTGGFGGKREQKEYLKELKKYILDSEGKPKVKTHGFAVTSFELMTVFPWHSVDSASWIKQGSFGGVWVSNKKDGDEYVFDSTPWTVNFSPKSPYRNEKRKHYLSLKGLEKKKVDDYLEHMDLSPGDYTITEVEPGYKLGKNELWFKNPKKIKQPSMSGFVSEKETNKPSVLRYDDKGLVNCHNTRFFANLLFMKEMEKNVPTENIYFAGGEGSLEDRVELATGKRLMSYHYLTSGNRPYKALEKHLEIIR